MNLTSDKIRKLLDPDIHGILSMEVRRIMIDSRKVKDGEGILFVAIRGERNDGHHYLRELFHKGVRVFIVQKLPDTEEFPGACFYRVEDSLKALHRLARYFREGFDRRLTGITGSNGKTIIKEWLFQSLDPYRKIVRSPESYNSQVGVPLSLFLLDPEYEEAFIEAGISRPGEMEKLEEMIRPDWGIFTNLGDAHQDNFGSYEEKAKEKAWLFRNSEKVIYCRDHSHVHQAIASLPENVEKISWGRKSSCKYRLEPTLVEEGSFIRVTRPKEFRFAVPFSDPSSLENLCHVIVYLLESGMEEEDIQSSLKGLEPVAMRQEMLHGLAGCMLISDTYNSDIHSLSNALDYLNLQHQGKAKTLILSDILQSNRDSRELYQAVAAMIREKGISRFIGIGRELSLHKDLFPEDSRFFATTESFLSQIDDLRFANEAILIKGSRRFSFERISSRLQEQAHRTRLEIDFHSMVENLNYYRSLLGPGVRTMAMVKAFSYGSGGYEIASVLEYHKVDSLAVAFADEGVELRRKGIRMPVLVMNPEVSDFDLITRFDLEPELYNLRILEAFNHYLRVNAIAGYPVHIKADTGMHRLGFVPGDLEKLARILDGGSLEVVSVFSHLAAADEPAEDAFTRDQVSRFLVFCEKLKGTTGRNFLKHILNSAGIERFPEYQFDMVRLGIGLYGVGFSESAPLTEISTFKTRISHIREIGGGETVGYNRAGKLNRVSRIATIPAGYADGIPRSLSRGVGKFMINHHLAAVTGNVCMDMTMLDVTDIPAKEGDEVIIFGREHSVRRMAEMAGTIPYEILTSVSRRVKRVYIQE